MLDYFGINYTNFPTQNVAGARPSGAKSFLFVTFFILWHQKVAGSKPDVGKVFFGNFNEDHNEDLRVPIIMIVYLLVALDRQNQGIISKLTSTHFLKKNIDHS